MTDFVSFSPQLAFARYVLCIMAEILERYIRPSQGLDNVWSIIGYNDLRFLLAFTVSQAHYSVRLIWYFVDSVLKGM